MRKNCHSFFWVFALMALFTINVQAQDQQGAKKQAVQELQQMVDDLKAENPNSPQLPKLEQKLSEEEKTASKPTSQQLQQAIKGYQDKLTYLEKRQVANPANLAISKRIAEIKSSMAKLQKQTAGDTNQ